MINSGQRQLMAKKEVTMGTYLAPVPASDFDVKIYDLGDISRDYGHTGGMNYADGTFIKGPSYAGKKSGSIQFKTELQFSGTLATSPKWFKIIEACGYQVTNATNAKATWDGKPNCQSLTLHHNQYNCGSSPTGVCDVLAGAVGTFDLGAESVGAPIMFNWTFTGKSGGTIDLAGGSFTLPSGFDTAPCQLWIGSGTTLTIGAYVYRVYSWTFSQQNDVKTEDNAADVTNGISTGIARHAIKGANPQLKLVAERVAKATNDPYSLVENSTVQATAVIATSNFDITFSGVQMIDIQAGNKDDTATEEITLKINTVEFKQARL